MYKLNITLYQYEIRSDDITIIVIELSGIKEKSAMMSKRDSFTLLMNNSPQRADQVILESKPIRRVPTSQRKTNLIHENTVKINIYLYKYI